METGKFIITKNVIKKRLKFFGETVECNGRHVSFFLPRTFDKKFVDDLEFKCDLIKN